MPTSTKSRWEKVSKYLRRELPLLSPAERCKAVGRLLLKTTAKDRTAILREVWGTDDRHQALTILRAMSNAQRGDLLCFVAAEKDIPEEAKELLEKAARILEEPRV